MKVPTFRVLCLGEFTAWGRQFISALHGAHILEATYEPSVQHFIEAGNRPMPQVIVVENVPESRQTIGKIRQLGKRAYLIWLGRSFTKEDMAFALDHRVYTTFESIRPDDKRVPEALKRLALSMGHVEQFEEISRSLKSILLQAEGEIPKAVLSEIKSAVGKLEQFGLANEFSGMTVEMLSKNDGKIPLAKEQGLSDALSTVHNLERTGVLWVRGSTSGEEGKVEFLQGKIVSALAGEAHGIKAIFRMFLWDAPRFLFMRRDPREANVDEPVSQSLKYICSEGEEWKSRYEKIRREIPPADLKLELEPGSLHVGTNLDMVEFSTLASVVEFGTVSQILDYNQLPDVCLYEALIQLRRHNLIRVSA
jgi:hypothetical protein